MTRSSAVRPRLDPCASSFDWSLLWIGSVRINVGLLASDTKSLFLTRLILSPLRFFFLSYSTLHSHTHERDKRHNLTDTVVGKHQ